MKIIRPLILACLFWPQLLMADGSADLMLLPTRLVLGDKDYFGTVVVKNPGQATGNYSLALTDMRMEETGDVVPVEAGGQTEYSAVPFLHVAPRSLALKPGEFRQVRLMLRKPANLEDGEYRAHLKVWIVDDSADAPAAAAAPAREQTLGITPKTHLTVIIPVIFRHGKTSLAMQIDAPKLSYDADGTPVLSLYLARAGNRSSMGDISVSYLAPDGTAQPLAQVNSIPVYRSTPRRQMTIPLDVPRNISLKEGRLKITYAAQENEGGQVLAEKILSLPK